MEGLLVAAARDEEVPTAILRFFDITPRVWSAMSDTHRLALKNIADGLVAISARNLDYAVLAKAMGMAAFNLPPLGGFFGNSLDREFKRMERQLREQGTRIIDFTQRLVEERAGSSFGSYHPVLADLENKLSQPYSFVAYAADGKERHVNYGIRLQWRLKLEPRTYQVGELVRSIPLTPGEKRKVMVRSQTVRKQSKTFNSLAAQESSFERSETVRAEEEILRRAQQSTKFNLSTEGEYDIGISEGTATSSLSHDVGREASDTKRRIREAVIKEAQAIKNEMKTEVVTSEEATLERTEEGAIENPNDQITVTYLFYLLQRRCTMTQSLHRATPVAFVAQELPARIDKVWLIQNAPILRQVLLDATLLPALEDLCNRMVGDEFAVEQLRLALVQRRKLVDEMREDLSGLKTATEARLGQLRAAMEKQAAIQEDSDTEGFWTGLWENVITGDDSSPEAARMRMEAAREDFERAETAQRDLTARFERELGALEAAQKEYTEALRQQLDRESRVEQLRLHVAQYLLVYLKAIWMLEPPEQRELRLRNTPAPWMNGERRYRVVDTVAPAEAVGRWTGTTYELEPDFAVREETTVPLGTIADLRTLLAVEGNYLVVPLKEHTLVSEFMLTPFFHPELGLRDPDELGWALSDFHRYARALKDTDLTAFTAALPRLRALESMLRSSPRRETEDIIVPTGALFVEALPGRHTVMQEDSLFHRKMDALKAALDVQNQQHLTRSSALENLRYAQRLLDGETGDPEAEVRVEGNGAAVVVPMPPSPGPGGPGPGPS
jgi:multidrug efflux pump subunit AcrA (membrane-fusion protein)